MKKTLIALAVAASAVVSGSAMAWTENGTGGAIDLWGILTPVEKVTPWEVKVGDAVSGLDAQIQKGQKEVSITVNKAIPVLGIRNADAHGFKGRKGEIHPQIDYDGAINLNGFSNGVTTLTLNVTTADGNKLGTLSAPFSSAAVSSWGGVVMVMVRRRCIPLRRVNHSTAVLVRIVQPFASMGLLSLLMDCLRIFLQNG